MDGARFFPGEGAVRSVCFTGHRQMRLTGGLQARLFSVLEKLIQRGAVDFYAGGAIGWDTVCARAALTLRDNYPGIRLNLLLPCPPTSFTLRWTPEARAMLSDIARRADSVNILAPSYYQGCMRERNLRLVEAADCCVCYYDSTRRASGTGQTVRFAEQKGIEIINLLEEQQ